MNLHYQLIGTLTEQTPIVILHGLFGSSVNWRKVGQALSQHAPVILVDLRNHGRSPHSDEINYPAMAQDVVTLLDDLNFSTIKLIGHSVGGKVAMTISDLFPQRLEQMVVVDISPRHYPHGDSTPIFDALRAVDLTVYKSRSEVDSALSSTIKEKLMRLFLLMNLEAENGKLSWRINLKGLHESYPTLLSAVCEDSVISTPSCFIRGTESDYVAEQDIDLISQTFVNAQIYDIEGAAHWVHSDQPDAFISQVKEFFDYD